MVREVAPHFEEAEAVYEGDISSVSLTDYGGSWMMLVFYPLSQAAGEDLLHLNSILDDLKQFNVDVIAITNSDTDSLFAWTEM